jgi:hypothetical protein
MSEWRCRSVLTGIVSTVLRLLQRDAKKHHFHLTKRVRTPSDTTCGAAAIGCSRSRAILPASRAQHRPIFDKCSKPRFYKGFCNVAACIAAPRQAAAEHASSTASASSRCSESAESPMKKILGNVCARVSPRPESDANRANRLQVIRGRRPCDDVLATYRAAAATFFCQPDALRTDENGRAQGLRRVNFACAVRSASFLRVRYRACS